MLKKHFAYFFLGFFALSSFASYFLIDIVHLPNCLIEVFLFPIFLYNYKKIKISVPSLLFLFFYLLIFTLIGACNRYFTFQEILPTARCYFLGGIALLIFKDNKVININKLYILSLGAICGDILNGVLVMRDMLILSVNKEYAVDMNIILLPVCIGIAFIYKNKYHVILVLFLSSLAAFYSVSRGISSFIFLAVLISLFISSLGNKRKFFGVFLIFCGAAFLSYHIYTSMEHDVERLSPSLHYRMYTKVKKSGTNSADETRFKHVVYMYNNLERYVWPRGFIGKAFVSWKERDLMLAWDSSFGELLYTFGLCFVLFFIFYLSRVFRLYKKCKINAKRKTLYPVLFVVSILLLFQLNFGYGLLKSPFSIFCFGAFLGMLLRSTRSMKMI